MKGSRPSHKLLHPLPGALGDINRTIRTCGDVVPELELPRAAAVRAEGVEHMTGGIELHRLAALREFERRLTAIDEEHMAVRADINAIRTTDVRPLPLIEKRLDQPGKGASFGLMSLLENIKSPASARLAERELRRELAKPDGNRRACYIAIGLLGFRDSEPLLLEAYKLEKADPDDSLIWALGCCGGEQSIPVLRKSLESTDKSIRLAAIAALGLCNDRDSIPKLLKLATDAEDHNTRYNAIYALGRLKAKEALPLLLKNLREEPKCEHFYSPTGIYEYLWTHAGDYVDVSVRAVQRLGDKEALPEFERILRDDRYYLNFAEVANAAAELGWRELVPAIIARLVKDHKKNVELFGEEREKYAPALRKLTGRPFGEDPQLWLQWQKSQTSTPASRSP